MEGLAGWRYVVSLMLETGDVVGPMLRTLLGCIGSLLSWLLVTMIGRSLGLVYRGVMQSLSGRDRGAVGGRRRGGQPRPSARGP
jgi:uncharacterized membrane protein YeaQ/YmgE (transglycosylase-associated protein family)